MATIYWDPTSGTSGGAGTFADPKDTLANASTAAGAGGETRLKSDGDKSLLDAATWTNGQTYVDFDSDVGLTPGGGDWIFCDIADGEGYWVYTTAYSGAGPYRATIAKSFCGTTGSYDTYLAAGVHTLSATQSPSVAGQTHTFGWTADGVQGGMSLLKIGATDYILDMTYSGTLDLSVGPLVLGFTGGASGSRCFNISTQYVNVRIIGTLWCSTATSSSFGVDVNHDEAILYADTVVTAGLGNYPVTVTAGKLVIGKAVAYSDAVYAAVRSADGHLTVGDCRIYSNGGLRYAIDISSGGVINIDRLKIRRINTSYPPSSTNRQGRISVGYLDKDQAFTCEGPFSIGAPVAEWQWSDKFEGVCNKPEAGRGGSGYCYRITPNLADIPHRLPIVRPLPASAVGKTVTLKFYAVYTGTVSDPPICNVRVKEANGLTIEDKPFTPARTANTPGGAPDGWDDATQQSITFSGTVDHAGSLQVEFLTAANAADDAVLYIDDITWVLA